MKSYHANHLELDKLVFGDATVAFEASYPQTDCPPNQMIEGSSPRPGNESFRRLSGWPRFFAHGSVQTFAWKDDLKQIVEKSASAVGAMAPKLRCISSWARRLSAAWVPVDFLDDFLEPPSEPAFDRAENSVLPGVVCLSLRTSWTRCGCSFRSGWTGCSGLRLLCSFFFKTFICIIGWTSSALWWRWVCIRIGFFQGALNWRRRLDWACQYHPCGDVSPWQLLALVESNSPTVTPWQWQGCFESSSKTCYALAIVHLQMKKEFINCFVQFDFRKMFVMLVQTF